MRIFENCYELVSEIRRDVYEMGAIVKPKSMQNKKIEGDIDYETKEILNYSYCLQTLDKEEKLFIDESSREWVREELLERVNPAGVNPGKAWEIRKSVWEEYLVKEGFMPDDDDELVFDYSYGERMNMIADAPWKGQKKENLTNLQRVIKRLSEDPDTRQAILAIWDARKDTSRIGGIRRVPCSIYYQFIIRDNMVHIIYNQRSCDVVTHFGNDVWLAWNLCSYVVEVLREECGLDVKHGYLYHNIASLHSYRKDWPILKKCITETQL